MAGRGIAGVLDANRFLIYGMNYGLMSGRKETESNFLFNLGEVESWSFGGKWLRLYIVSRRGADLFF
jgi:hypothetical protein